MLAYECRHYWRKLRPHYLTMLVRCFIVLMCVVFVNTSTFSQPNHDLSQQEISLLLDSTKQVLYKHDHQLAGELLAKIAQSPEKGWTDYDRARYNHFQADWMLLGWQLRDAEQMYYQVIESWTEMQDSIRLIEAYSGLGTTLAEQERYQEAIGYQRKALDYFNQPDSVKYFEMRSNLAVSYTQARDHGKALEEYQNLKAVFTRKGLIRQLAIVEGNIGELYREGILNFQLAKSHLLNAAALNIETNQTKFLVQNYHNLGLTLMRLNEPDSARKYIMKSVSMRKEHEPRGGLAISMHLLGKYYLYVQNADSALLAFNKTLQISEEYGIGPGIFFGHFGSGETYELMNNYAEAHRAYTRAADKAVEIGSLQFQEAAEEALYNFFKNNKRYYEALKHSENLHALRDSANKYELREHLAQAKVRYETELAESENQLLKANQEKQVMQLERQQWLLWGLCALLFGILIAILILIWTHHQRKIAFNAAIVAKKEVETQYEKIKIQEKKLNETLAVKNRIFSVLGHDLRSPLANISSMLPMATSGDLPKEEVKRIFSHLQQETDQSLNTLHNILQWSQLQCNEVALRRQYLSVKEYLSELEVAFKPSACQKNISLQFVDQSNGEVYADDNQFRSILTNLISNAIKFSPNGERVIVSAKENNNGVAITVTDRGQGFATDVLAVIQQRENPVSYEGTHGEKGTGIGLQLVRDFVVAHGGELIIDDNPTGGATVTVTFPHVEQREQQQPTRQRKSA